jgi:hypothetical protein
MCGVPGVPTLYENYLLTERIEELFDFPSQNGSLSGSLSNKIIDEDTKKIKISKYTKP